jgi:hypothetical protein
LVQSHMDTSCIRDDENLIPEVDTRQREICESVISGSECVITPLNWGHKSILGRFDTQRINLLVHKVKTSHKRFMRGLRGLPLRLGVYGLDYETSDSITWVISVVSIGTIKTPRVQDDCLSFLL